MKLYDIYKDLTIEGKTAYSLSAYIVYQNEVDVDYDTDTVIYDYTIKINGSVVREEMTLEDVIEFFNDLYDEMEGEYDD